MTEDKRIYAVWLSRALTAGGGSFPRLLRAFSSPEEIYRAEKATLCEVLGTQRADLSALLDHSLTDAIKDVRYCDATQTEIISYFDRAYPARLRRIASPPAVLYVRGTLPTDTAPCIAIVGSRRTSDVGRRETFRIAEALGRAGYVTVSGLAKGVDGVCAAGTLAGGGISVAVLAGGVDTVYPRSHEALAASLVKGGALVSEFPIGKRPLRYHFPIRNRLIAGLCDALLLTEGEEKSGSVITARIAMREGRTVYALCIKDADYCKDAAMLLSSEGAVSVNSVNTLLDKLSVDGKEQEPLTGGMIDRALARFGVDLGTAPEAETQSPDAEHAEASVKEEQETVNTENTDGQTLEARILTCLAQLGEADLDQLCEQLGDATPARIQTALMMLSVSGRVEPVPGGRYRYIPV